MMDLMELLPSIYDKNSTMQELQGILSDKVNAAISNTGATVDECFIGTVSALLARYEKIYGITMDVTKPDSLRREILRAKIAGVGTVTKQMLIDTVASYSKGTVEIIEYPETYSFVVKFTDTLGIPPNMPGLTNTINEIKPAHLSYSVFLEDRVPATICTAAVSKLGITMTLYPWQIHQYESACTVRTAAAIKSCLSVTVLERS